MKTSLRKLPIFREATTSFPAKYRLRNEHRNFILMTCHYPNLGSASAMMKKIPFAVRPIRGTFQIWLVTRHQYGKLRPFLLRRHFAGKPVVALPNIGCFLNLVPRVLSGFEGRRERTLGRRLFFCSYCRF